MSTKLRVVSSDHYFHVSARSSNKEWFRLPMQSVWSVYEDYLFFTHHAFEIEILNFVLMHNHFHMICKAPRGNLSQAMNYFMRETSRVLGFETRRINHIYGGPFRSSLLLSQLSLLHAYKYVYRNPVEPNLVKNAEDWKFSTLPGLLGCSKLIIPVVNDFILFGDGGPAAALDWINRGYVGNHREEIKHALARRRFTFAKNQNTKRPSELNEILS